MPTEIIQDCATGVITEQPFTIPFAEQKAAKAAAIKPQFQTVMLAGYTHNFGGSAGIRTLDMRDADDKANWTLLLIKCQGLNAAGSGSTSVTIRSQDNDTFTTTAATALTAMQAMLAWGEASLAHKWALDASVEAAANQSQLDAIDIGVGWPG